MHSQNQEEQYILSYFSGTPVGRFLDIGAADGKTLSNTYALYRMGWGGVMVEPSPYQYAGLLKNIPDDRVVRVNAAIEPVGGMKEFYFCEDFVSTTDIDHYNLWKGAVKYNKGIINIIGVQEFLKELPGPYHFINIDIEGGNYSLLKSMPIRELGCRCICVEYGNEKDSVKGYLESLGYSIIYTSAENFVAVLNS